MAFKALELSAPVLRGIQAAGYSEPTPIQLRAIPVVLSGRDLVGSAQTGTGKTAAFALPILSKLGGHNPKPRVLVLEPTRELAAQVETAFRDFARFTDNRAVALFGGVGYGAQRQELKRGVDIVVATPAVSSIISRAANCRSATSRSSCSTRSIACSTWASCRW